MVNVSEGPDGCMRATMQRFHKQRQRLAANEAERTHEVDEAKGLADAEAKNRSRKRQAEQEAEMKRGASENL